MDDKRLTEVICESSDVFDREAMTKGRTITAQAYEQRPSLEKESGSRRRNPLSFKDRGPVERPAGEVSEPQHLLETSHALGRPRCLAEYLEGLLK